METNDPTEATGNNPSQSQQLRASVKNQIEHLKAHIRDIQKESLKSMHDVINKTFQTMVADNLDNLNQQEKNVQQQVDQAMQGNPSVSSGKRQTTQPSPGEAIVQPEGDADAGKNAIEIARISAEQAMKHASEMVQAATKF